ncbi:MAG: HlyD family efflux transporter periplasmic adaptor subunit [Phycisphaera sp.]|nr:HlyD family efflux transporter periplasmic adaptor subunit [Phycisphaera sp.]
MAHLPFQPEPPQPPQHGVDDEPFQRDNSGQAEQAMSEPLPAVRKDLEISPQLYLGKIVYVVKDPVSLTYFRLKPAEHFVLKNLDGQASANDMARKLARHFPEQPADAEQVMVFIRMLQGSGLLLGRGESHGEWIRENRDERRRKNVMAQWFNFLFIKIPIMDPDHLLDDIYSFVRFFMNRKTMWLAAIFLVSSLVAIGLHLDRVGALKFPVLGWINALMLTGTFLTVKVIHEFGHGLAAKHRGLEVHEIGVMMMVFFPVFYVDVSDAWMVTRRSDRLWINAGGVYIECLFASIAAWVFLSTDPGVVNQIAFNTMLAASVTTVLFNANPLLRYDGYYFLMDWLEIPNLRSKAGNYCGYLAKRYLLGMDEEVPPHEASTHPIFMPLYSAAAGVYRWVVVFGIIAVVWHLLDPYGLEVISAIMGIVAVVTMLLLPLGQMLSFVWSQQKARTGRQVAISVLGVVALFGVAAGILAIPTDQTVKHPVVVLAVERQPVFAFVPGRVDEVHVDDGQYVHKGDPLLTLRNPPLVDRLDQLGVSLRLTQLQLESSRIDGRIDVVASLTTQIKHIREQIDVTNEKIAELVVRAPIDGRIQTYRRLQTLLGMMVDRGDEIALVVGDQQREVDMVLPETDASLVEVDDRVNVRLWGSAELARVGHVERVGSQILKSLPHEALSSRFKGEVDTVPTSQYNSAPSTPSVIATITMDPGQAPLPLDGSTGRGSIIVEEKVTLAAQLWRRIRQVISPDYRLWMMK